MRLTPQEVYDRLIEEDILNIHGVIKYQMGTVSIIVKQRDVVGNILQEWVQGWLRNNSVDFALNPNSQMPPDFYLNPDNLETGLLEVKAFNRAGSPGFDIADFLMYQREIIERPYMLDVDYLIFGYKMDETGFVRVQDLWLKKVWQITRRMENWPLNLQVKRDVVHKMRPGVWYSNSGVPMFRSKEDFLSAIEETVYQDPRTHNTASSWRRNFRVAYRQYYGTDIEIPRWSDIRDTY